MGWSSRARNQIKNNAYGCSFCTANYPISFARLCQEFFNFRMVERIERYGCLKKFGKGLRERPYFYSDQRADDFIE